jgi:hypothetical protein
MNPFKTLFETAHLRFTSPHLLRDCMTRFRDINGFKCVDQGYVRYDLKYLRPKSADTCEFALHIGIPRNGLYISWGEFYATGDGQTEVAVEFEVHLWSRLSGLLIVGIIGLAAIVAGLTGYGILSPVLLLMAGFLIFLLRETTVYARRLIFDEIKTKLLM